LQDYVVKTNSYAGYAQANWHATDSLSFTLGGRYTRDEKSFDGSTISNTVLWRSGSADLSTDFSAFTPKFGIDFKASDDILVYGSVSKGFKSGGYQGRAFNLADLNKPYDPETVWTYEAGVKSTLLDDRVRFNFAYFYNDFKDLQLNVLNGVTGGGTIIQNAASAKVEGLEVEFTAVPVQNLNVFANFATLWDRYKAFDIPISNVNIASDLAATPTFTMQAGFDYTIAMGDAGGVTFGGDYNRSTPYHPGPVNGREVMIKELNLFNGFIRYQSEAGNWDVGVYAKNILDKEYWFTGFVQGSFSSVIPAEPRTVKLTLNYRFN
jgi:iron complex outermembrane receptor protein